MTLPRYQQYRDSGMPWVGGIPSHWDVTRLKRIASVQTGIAKGKDVGGKQTVTARYLRVANVQDGFLALDDIATIEIEADQLARYQLLPGDVLMNEGGDFDKLGRGAIWRGEIPGCIHQNHVFAVRPHGVDAYWLNQVTGSRYAQFYFMGRAKQSTNLASISSSNIVELPVLMPPVDERTEILAFLERETRKIDALIAEQEKLIALLAEKRQATISHAVTRGRNPDAPMKDSGVAWLAAVPVHWDLVMFQRCVFVAEGQVDPEEQPYRSMLLIAPNHVESGTGRLLYVETAEQQAAESGKYLCRSGDVVYSKIRPALRKVCIAPEDCLCSADMYPLRGNSRLANAFLMWFMLSEPFSAFAELESQRVAMPKINRDSLKEVWLALPPRAEQAEIVDFINAETARLDALKFEAERAITVLKERRSALITAAVTGQIDVRGQVQAPAAEPAVALA